MKKNLIALAVAAAAAAPLAAQAEMSVSGQLQLEISSMSADDALLAINGGNATEGVAVHDGQEGGKLNSGGYSAIAFSASEDLGNGLKGIAKYAIDPKVDSSAAGAIINRDAYLGLSGGFGTVLVGRLSTPYKSSTVKWDPFLATSGQARGNFGASKLHNSYANNVLAYANKFGPAKVVLAVSFDESDSDADGSYDGDNITTASVNMPVGPVEVAVAYLDNAGVSDGTATKVGVKYGAGAMGVNFQYESLGAGVADYGNDGESVMLLNGTYAMGANTFALSYGATSADFVGGTSADLTHTTVGVVHSFSKTTSVHAAYTALDADGDKASAVAVGMRVKF